MYCLQTEVGGRQREWQKVIVYLTLQEKEDGGLNEVGVGALSASPLGSTLLLGFPLAEQS